MAKNIFAVFNDLTLEGMVEHEDTAKMWVTHLIECGSEHAHYVVTEIVQAESVVAFINEASRFL